MDKHIWKFLFFLIIGTLTSCSNQNTPPVDESSELPSTPVITETNTTTETQTATPEPPRLLTICSQEPASLFIYGDTSSAASSILQAVYDGPIDMLNFEARPVILEMIPSVQNGDVKLQPVDVAPGELIIDASGDWVALSEGVVYRPAGCSDPSCDQTYESQDQGPVQMDVMSVVFHMLPGIQWSDGEPLTASDSVFSFGVFESLFKSAFPEVLRMTASYEALDDHTLEWVGIPGYVGPVATRFFSPLPEHQLGNVEVASLMTSEISTRTPLGWGPYVITEWVSGDHITLNRNPNYFRASEGLPHFDHVVYRFMDGGDEAIDALVIGECDFIDRTVLFEENIPRLQAEEAAGNLSFSVQTGIAWELAAFGIDSLDEGRLDFFEPAEVRQALAMCIDRQKIVDDLLFGVSFVPATYVPLQHPYANPEISPLEFDPEAASVLLDSIGWVDHDSNSQTPRVSRGIPEIPDGTPLAFTYRVPSDGERPAAAQIIKDGFARCGVGLEILQEDWDVLMQPGPEGPLFGRQFDMAQFAWQASFEPSCALFMSDEIPGPYPEYPKAWGGGNLAGYHNPDFDAQCQQAMSSLSGSETHRQAHFKAQEIFLEDMPVIPLYQRIRLVATRPDMCNLVVDPGANSALSQMELIDYGESCK